MNKIFLQSAIFFFLFLPAKSQNLTGTWEGSTTEGAEYWRISIVQIGDSCYGYSYDEGPGYCKENFKASFNQKRNTFQGEGFSFISRTPDHILIAVALQYEREGRDEYLVGDIMAKSLAAKVLSLGIGAAGRLKRISTDVDSTVYIKSTVRRLYIPKASNSIKDEIIKKELSVTTIYDSTVAKKIFEDSVVTIKNNRTTVVTKTIITSADSVKIILYDDGEIDGDIVTIFDNGKIVVNKLVLTKEPYQISLSLPLNNSMHTVELMAENEGSIPPNTAYMLVLAGNERVEVKVSSDKLSNAAIVIQKSE